MENNLKRKVMTGLAWTFGERIAAQGVSFIVSVIIARLLDPTENGVVALILVFINIANVFVTNGFGEALVQKQNSDEIDFSSVFYCSFASAIILYFGLFISAPMIASFYEQPILTGLIRVLAIKIPISAISTIQHAYVSKHMIFKKFFFSTLGGTLFSGVVGIFAAYYGFGPWALVFQYLTNTTIDTIVLFITVPWRPKFVFSASRAKSLIGYSWKLTATGLITSVYNELRSLIIGKVYSPADLAYYNRGNQLPTIVINNLDTAIGKVVFPAMVTCKDDASRLKTLEKKAMSATTYLIFPLLVALAVMAEQLITVVYTTKWLPCVPFLRILCVYWATQPIQTMNWQVLKACGRSDLCFKLEIVKKGFGLVLLFATMKISVRALAISACITGILALVINALPVKKLIDYSLTEQIMDLCPAAIMSAIMGFGMYTVSLFVSNIYFQIVAQGIVGVVIYLVLSVVTKNESLKMLVNVLLGIVKRRK